ncbi:hypothetical protein BGZ57DRAFT_1004104 [Hyaloscypha finlandica]|nr:hypothetical protein BGZ57DRAFT_1004104 [Hyaloscypha finlandica]
MMKMYPRGPRPCIRCTRKQIACTWTTVGGGGRSSAATEMKVHHEEDDEDEEGWEDIEVDEDDEENKEKGKLILSQEDEDDKEEKKPRKEEFEEEDPWRYMAALPLGHVPTMRRVMILTHHKLSPAEKLFPMPHLNWAFLTREERKRVITMVHESNGNDLLVEMLRWFSAKFMEEDKEVEKATQTLRKLVTNAVRQPKSYQVEYFKQRKLWSEFLGRKEDDDVEMGGMDGGIRLSTTVSRPSEFITSIHQPQGGENGDDTRLPGSIRNTLRGVKPRVETTFQPSYSYKSETWREDITFNEVSAKTHYRTGGWGETSFAAKNKRKQEDIELPYTFTAADEDVSTDSDPDERDEEVNIFATAELPCRKTRTGKEFSAYGFQQPSKKLKTSPTKTPSTPKRSSSAKTITTPKNKASAFKSMLEASMPMTDCPKPIIKSPNGKPKDAVVRVKFVDEDEELDDWEPEMGGDKQ